MNFVNEFIGEAIELMKAFEYEYVESVSNTHNFLLSTSAACEDSCHLSFAAEIIRIAAEYDCKSFAHDGNVFSITIENTTFNIRFVDGWNM